MLSLNMNCSRQALQQVWQHFRICRGDWIELETRSLCSLEWQQTLGVLSLLLQGSKQELHESTSPVGIFSLGDPHSLLSTLEITRNQTRLAWPDLLQVYQFITQCRVVGQDRAKRRYTGTKLRDGPTVRALAGGAVVESWSC